MHRLFLLDATIQANYIFGLFKLESTLFNGATKVIPSFLGDELAVLLFWFPPKPSCERVKLVTYLIGDVKGGHGVIW